MIAYVPYNAALMWAVGQTVLYSGAVYECKVKHGPSPSYVPTNVTYWTKLLTLLTKDTQKLEPGTLVDLFILDTTGIEDLDGDPGGLLYFTAGLNDTMGSIVFQGNTYNPYPIQITGFEFSGTGKAPHPRVSVSNILGLMTSMNFQYDDLVRAKVTRKRTFARYLDGEPEADPTAEFPLEIFYIERKVSETTLVVEYELTGIYDLDGFMLPNTQIVADFCPWVYKGEECGYTGGAVGEVDDTPTGDPALDRCGKRLASCYLRYPDRERSIPFGGFPSVNKMRV